MSKVRNKYFLYRVKRVNEIYIEYHGQGYSNIYIYKNHIREEFGISLCTFYSYLSINYKRLMKENLTGSGVKKETKEDGRRGIDREDAE
jgi:hypothetical protein